MSLLNRRRVLLAKLESSYAADAAPGNANAILLLDSGFDLKPLVGAEVERKFIRPFFGGSGKIRVENYSTLTFEVELAGSGHAGSVPAYSPLLRACGLSETIIGSSITGALQAGNTTSSLVLPTTASAIDNFYDGMTLTVTSGALSGQSRILSGYNGTTKVAQLTQPLASAPATSVTVSIGACVSYSPVSLAQESCTLYFNVDGVRHILIGAMGTVSGGLTVKQVPSLKFAFTGLLGTITDNALPQADYSAFKNPVACSTANTVNFRLHGCYSNMIDIESLSWDLANAVVYRSLIGQERVIITERNSTGKITFESMPVASNALHTDMSPYNWYAAAKSKVRGPLIVQHGTASGNSVILSAPAVEIGDPSYSDSQGISMTNLTLDFVPSQITGNDEIKLTFQ